MVKLSAAAPNQHRSLAGLSGADGGNGDAASHIVPRNGKLMIAPFTVLIDTRESAPWRFDAIEVPAHKGGGRLLVQQKPATLASGDYSIDGLQDAIAIERKSLDDLYSTLGQGRERFEREHQRLADMVQFGGFAAVVIEASLEDVVFRPPVQSRMSPLSVVGTWAAWSQRYSVPWVWASNRRLGEWSAWQLLEKFWNHRSERR